MELIIRGETPAKKNSRINTRSGRSFPSRRYSEWHKLAKEQVFVQCLQQAESNDFAIPLGKPCRVSMAFIHGDLRRRDSDNGTSSILDLLTDCGVIEDDNWQIVRELVIENGYEKGNPYCKVEIETL